MAFNAQTDHKESLQTLAMAMRQEKGSDITSLELAEAMNNIGELPARTKKNCHIDYQKMTTAFNVWVNGDDKGWVDSSVYIANRTYPAYCARGEYIFYRQDFVPEFKGTYNRIRGGIKENADSSVMKKMYSLRGLKEDKWNPADIIAIKSDKETQVRKLLKDFKASKVSKMSKEVEAQNKKMDLKGKTGKTITLMEDLDEMYEYNKLIDDLFKKKEVVGISLKKATTKTFPMKVMRHKDSGGIKQALNLNIKITSVHYLPTNQKCIVEFDVSGKKGSFLDIRGFDQSKKIADVQIQLSLKGSAAAHGKITLPIVTMLTKLSRGRVALSKLNAEKRKRFGSSKLKSAHGFTDWTIFNDYVKNPVQFSVDSDKWCDYIQWLSNTRHDSAKVKREVQKLLGKKSDVFKAAKYLKHKVQSYEVGYILDKDQKQIHEDIKENIIKSIVTYSGSKGMVIFNNKNAAAYMISSTYLKCGG